MIIWAHHRPSRPEGVAWSGNELAWRWTVADRILAEETGFVETEAKMRRKGPAEDRGEGIGEIGFDDRSSAQSPYLQFWCRGRVGQSNALARPIAFKLFC